MICAVFTLWRANLFGHTVTLLATFAYPFFANFYELFKLAKADCIQSKTAYGMDGYTVECLAELLNIKHEEDSVDANGNFGFPKGSREV